MKRLKTLPSAALFGVFLFTFTLLNCGSKNDYSTNPPAGVPGTNEVWMESSSFNPSNLTVTPGTTVMWTNKDSYAHDIASGTPDNPDGLFSKDNLAKGASFNYTFNNEGTYKYYCKLHSGMNGTVTVKKSSSSGSGY
ncbi:MAG: plastocyanin/azurin family copper-binding protein [Patescibacteria group bacterium]|nr:plastocyanin/azurin family copper-binding protein [Patescibacteria group bacterium]